MLSLYLHLPFCRHKCSYCDLNAYAGLDSHIPAYVAALVKEIHNVSSAVSEPVHTIYFGGGTPSLVPIPLLANIFTALHTSFTIQPDVEISFEANPESLTADYIAGLRQLGINRLSLGAQSAQPHELELFQRTHTFADVERAFALARAGGFQNLSLDLIYAIPGQSLAAWQDTLARSLEFGPDHFSVYALSYDFETPMRAWIQRGLLAEPDGNLAADMYGWADETLTQAGYHQYELSTWVNGPYECRHNLQYWHNQPYLGLGAGAHGYWNGQRYANVAAPTAYIARMAQPAAPVGLLSAAVQTAHAIDRRTEMNETLLTGLRLNEGVRDPHFRARFGTGLMDEFGDVLEELRRRQLVEWDGDCLRLTHSARFVSNWVFEKFV